MDPSELASSDPDRILDVFAALRAASCGVVDSPVVLEPRPYRPVRAGDVLVVSQTSRPANGGLRCERIFGSARELLCVCGRLAGEEHEGARCETCGVEVVREHVRAGRTAHVVAPTPVLHPALAGRVAEALGLEREDVVAVARMRAWIDRTDAGLRVTHVPVDRSTEGGSVFDEGERALLDLSERLLRPRPDGGLERSDAVTGGEGLAELLVERGHRALLFHEVPVPPLGDRPLERGVGGDVVLGPVDRAYVPLVAAARKAARLVELNAPLIIVLGARAAVQRAFEQMLSSLAGGENVPDPGVLAGYLPRAPRDPEPFQLDPAGPRPERPIDVAFTGHDELLITFPFASFRVAFDGSVRAAWPRVGGTITGGGPAHVVLRGSPLSVHELATGAPVAGWPEGVHAWAFEEAHERGTLVDPIGGVATELTDLGDYPYVVRGTPDGRHVWVEDKERSGGIYRVADGVLEATCAPWGEVVDGGVPTLRANGRITRSSDEMAAMNVVEGALARTDALHDALGFVSYAPHDAVVLTPHAGFRVLHDQRVIERTRSLLHVAFPIAAAAFAPGGARLAIVSRDAVHVVSLQTVDVETPESIAVIDLAPVLREVTFRKRTRTPPEREAELLARYGTVSAMLAADDAELESAGVRSPAALRAKLG